MKAQLHTTDTIFATIRKSGMTVAQHTFSGFDSISAVVKELCGRHSDVSGLVSIQLRNGTLGWSEQFNVRL